EIHNMRLSISWKQIDSLTMKAPSAQESVVPRPRSPTQSPIADEVASTGVDVRYGGATTTVTGLEAGQCSGLLGQIWLLQSCPYILSMIGRAILVVGSHLISHGLPAWQSVIETACASFESVTSVNCHFLCAFFNPTCLETDLKQTKLTYGAAYTKLIKKVKKLENKVKSSQARRRSRIIVSNDEDDLEDPSKQGRKIAEIDQDPAISLDVSIAKKDVSTAKPVSIAGATVTTASVAAVSIASPTRRVSTADDITMAETLVYIRKSASNDKGKAKMDESEPVQTKTKLQIAKVHEAASSFNIEEWEDIQARVEANEELAQRLQVDEREMYTEVVQARMLVELINQRKRYFSIQRAEVRRNKPPTQAQQRTYMSYYIKHMGGYTLQQLRGYSFDEIKNLFETTMRRVHTFLPIESEIKRVIPELAAGSSKRDAKEELDQESSKRKKTNQLRTS
ncbi:hypothetical protein Tco_0903886, partial [Tanacetum coccineum]